MRIRTLLLALSLLAFPLGCPADDDDATGDDDSATADDDATGDDNATGDDDDATGDDDDATGDDDDATADDDATGDDDTTAGGAPHLVVQPTELDFGILCVGQPDNTPLRLINGGDGPLIVQGMNTTVPQVSFTEFVGPIGPGEEEVVWITAGCPAENEYTGEVRIYSNDVAHPTYEVPVFIACDEC